MSGLLKHKGSILKLVVSAILFWFLVYRYHLDLSLLTQFSEKPFISLLCMTIFLFMIVLNAERWHILNEAQNIHLSFLFTNFVMYLGTTCNNLLPGGAGGDFYRFYFLRKKYKSISRGKLLVSILFDRITGLIGVFVMMLIALFWILQKININGVNPLYLFSLFSMFFIFIFFVFMYSNLINQCHHYFSNKNMNTKIQQPLLKLLQGLMVYKKHPKAMFQCIILSLIIQILCLCNIMLIAKALNAPSIPLYIYIAAFMVTTIANLIPITPGGLGIGELAFANVIYLLSGQSIFSFATVYLGYRVLGGLTYLPGLIYLLIDMILHKKPNPYLQET